MLIDDNNKDPTFVYSVSEKNYKVPSRKEQAAREAGMLEGIGYVLEGDTFVDLINNAFEVRQILEDAYEERQNNWPSPLGNTETTRQENSFVRGMESALESSRRTMGWGYSVPGDDSRSWFPVIEK